MTLTLSGLKAAPSTLAAVRTAIQTQLADISRREHIPVTATSSQLLRPLVAYVCAQEVGIDPEHAKFARAMAATQVIHEASLYHDDVIDEGKYRRGKPTLPRQLGNRIAVMQGDRFIAAAFKLIAASASVPLMQDFARTIEDIINGEVLQNEYIGKPVPRNLYQQFNELKTGALFAFAARTPFYFVAQTTDKRSQLSALTLKLGTLYQYIDDFSDYALFTLSGKPPYQDFKARKWTLPLYDAAEFSWEQSLADYWRTTYNVFHQPSNGSVKTWETICIQSPLQGAADKLLKELSMLREELQAVFTQGELLSELLAQWENKITAAVATERRQLFAALRKRAGAAALPPLPTLNDWLYDSLAACLQAARAQAVHFS